MSISTEPDFPPLLAPGFHALTLAELRTLCVDRFPASRSRPLILEGLEQVLGTMTLFAIEGEVWVDGSFLTEKIDPNDSDIVVRLDSTFADSCNAEQMGVLEWVLGNLKKSHLCDSYVFCEYPAGHSSFWHGEWARAYWIKQFGFSRGTSLKGIALIKTP